MVTRWGVVALAAVSVLTVLGGVAALVIPRLGASAPPHSKRYISCVYAGPLNGPGADKGYCDRYAEDVARRTDLTQDQRDRLEPDARKAERAVQEPSSCADLVRHVPSGAFPECQGLPVSVRTVQARQADSRPLPADAEAIRLSLERAGFPGATVRVARTDDPAPHDTVVFGVPVGDACFVGYVAVPNGGGGYGLQGKLPDGRCLSA
jgi:hypothetical protein